MSFSERLWSERRRDRPASPAAGFSADRSAPAGPPVAAGGGWDFLAADSLFGDLDAPDREWIELSVPAVTFGKGRLVHEAGQAGEILLWLWRGRLHIVRTGPGGRSVEEAAIEPGTVFGEMLLAGQRLTGVRVEAIEESEVRLFRRADWERILLRKPIVAVRLLEILGQRLLQKAAGSGEPRPAGPRPAGADPADLTARLAGVLLRVADRHTGDLIGVNPRSLAEAIGAEPEGPAPVDQIARLLEEFHRARYLEKAGTRSRLRNPAALRRLAGG